MTRTGKAERTARLTDLYRDMARIRAFEIAIASLWEKGLISGEMHLGTGEEAVVAGVMAHLGEDDALAADHRSTPPFLLHGVDPVAILRELLGRPDGLCEGYGGHMHLFSKEHLAASSGIVGASGPAGAGLALAAKRLRPGTVAVAFFGEGAANQGALLETMNLAVAWQLPLLLVCKDNTWSITTRSSDVTGGELPARAASFGLRTEVVDGLDPLEVSDSTARLILRIRRGHGPVFLHAKCSRLDGHFLGDMMVRTATEVSVEGAGIMAGITRATLTPSGTSVGGRAAAVRDLLVLLARVRGDAKGGKRDPLALTSGRLRKAGVDVDAIEDETAREVANLVATALEPAPGSEAS
jgi:pyruvate dehydrogenase E1 component alpha subunit